MLKVYTSYFGKIKQAIHPVSISRYPPKWYAGWTFPSLAPSAQLLSDYKAGRVNEAEYTTIFQAQIRHQHVVKEVVSNLSRFANDDGIITLMCYEKPEDFCHRYLVAKWLEEDSNCVYLGEL